MKEFEKKENININYFRPERDQSGGMIGCFKSHITVITDAYKAGYKEIIVFEDDIIRTKSYDNINYTEIEDLIKTNNTWEIIQLSSFDVLSSLLTPMNSKYKHISQYSSVLASSYIINRRGMEKILRTYKEYFGLMQIDEYYKIIFKSTMWNVVPILFDQDRSIENNNIWFSKSIDKILLYIHTKTNIIYYLSVYKYSNGWILSYLIIGLIIYLIFKNIIKPISIKIINL
jgi:GR25 family glycosyltransferase involved in LPS biosynthesis